MKFNKGEVETPVPGEEQLHAQIYSEVHPSGKQLDREGPGGPGGVQYVPAKCPDRKKKDERYSCLG